SKTPSYTKSVSWQHHPKWGSITAKINWSGEGNRTTSHDTSNKAISTYSKINPIHISIHI
ncbi:hypothetical protein, partial [Escherichia coli]|uniref:hypothetical protein n=1 Tax=Escherichia coli TaxID=562 RepID=UPI0022E5B6D0